MYKGLLNIVQRSVHRGSHTIEPRKAKALAINGRIQFSWEYPGVSARNACMAHDSQFGASYASHSHIGAPITNPDRSSSTNTSVQDARSRPSLPPLITNTNIRPGSQPPPSYGRAAGSHFTSQPSGVRRGGSSSLEGLVVSLARKQDQALQEQRMFSQQILQLLRHILTYIDTQNSHRLQNAQAHQLPSGSNLNSGSRAGSQPPESQPIANVAEEQTQLPPDK